MNSFTWWLINLGVTFVWLAIAVKSESWFIALGVIPYLAIAFLIELPETSGAEKWDDDQEEDWFG